MILGIDTSLGTAVAVVDADGAVRSEVASHDALRHAEAIGTLLVDALAAAAGAPEGVTHVVAGMGPGPFTGLRIGIAAARAFALGRDIPVVPVVSHDAIALERLLADAIRGDQTPRFAVVTDARRRELAYTVYDGFDDDGLPVRASEPALSARDALDDLLAAAAVQRMDAEAVSGAMLAVVGARALAAGRRVGPDEALYLRSPDVVPPGAPKSTLSGAPKSGLPAGPTSGPPAGPTRVTA